VAPADASRRTGAKAQKQRTAEASTVIFGQADSPDLFAHECAKNALREQTRQARPASVHHANIRPLLQDALRTPDMAGRPLFTATAILSLALGIGANTAIYSFLRRV